MATDDIELGDKCTHCVHCAFHCEYDSAGVLKNMSRVCTLTGSRWSECLTNDYSFFEDTKHWVILAAQVHEAIAETMRGMLKTCQDSVKIAINVVEETADTIKSTLDDLASVVDTSRRLSNTTKQVFPKE